MTEIQIPCFERLMARKESLERRRLGRFDVVELIGSPAVCSVITTGCVATWRLIATTNASTSPADSEINPFATGFQTFLAAACTWSNLPRGAQMRSFYS